MGGRRPQQFLKGLGRAAAALALVLFTVACESPKKEAEEEAGAPDGLRLRAAEFRELPGWESDTLAEALPALRRSCQRLLTQPAERPLGPQGLAGRVGDWQAPCSHFDGLSTSDHESLRHVLESHFRPLAVLDGESADGLFTGYYEAELQGAFTRKPGYEVPLYGRPGDLVEVNLREFRADLPPERLVGRVEDGRLEPYPARATLENGYLDGRSEEVIWVSDPVDAFFLHVQGSGVVQIDEGGEVRVGFAGSNGRPFYAIGRALIEEGVLERDKTSMQAIRDWLRANPARAEELMHRNERFIFFRLLEGPGPIGAQGVALTAGRSLAIDPEHLPLGAPLWLETSWPASDQPLRRLMVAQDTGSAIKGVVRGDFFWGSGESALEQAGRMRQQGRYWLLLPQAVAEAYLAQS